MSPQAGTLLLNEIAPRLSASVPHRVPFTGSDDAQELYQEALALAAQLLDRVESLGKAVTPGNIAYYALQLLKSGRRSTGSSRTDALARGTQLSGRSIVYSLDEPVGGNEQEPFTLGDMLASDSEDPSMAAARRLDWDDFLDHVDYTEQAVARTLAEGGELQTAARASGVSPSTFSTAKQRLAADVQAFWGSGVMAEAVREPGWRDGIRAARERQACRWERNGAWGS